MSKTNHNLLNSRANLRVQRQVRSLQTQQTLRQPILPQQIQESLTQEEGSLSPKILKCFQTFQWKYDIDAHSPSWKKLFFHLVYLPFIRFCLYKLGIAVPEAIVLPNANLPKGALLIKEWQGCFSQKWRAEQEAAKHLHGGWTEVAFEWSEIAATVTDARSVCTASALDRRQNGKRNWAFEAAIEKLQDILVQTRPQTEALKSSRR